jgi:hypothetical protein
MSTFMEHIHRDTDSVPLPPRGARRESAEDSPSESASKPTILFGGTTTSHPIGG